MASTRYLLGLGCNRPHGRHGNPAAVLAAARAELAEAGMEVVAASPVLRSAAIGSDRQFANAALLVETTLAPPALLRLVKAIERAFGRRRGRRWGARVLDIDLLAWDQGAWPPLPRAAAGPLIVPHPLLVARPFAVTPAAALAPGWRLPRDGRTLRQAAARRPRPVDRPRVRP